MTPRLVRSLVMAAALALTPGLTALALTPALNCHVRKTAVDRAICLSPEDAALDREIVALYDRGLSKFQIDDQRRLAQSQVAYFRRRNGCSWASHHSAHPGTAITECVTSIMEERVRVLRAVVDRGRT